MFSSAATLVMLARLNLDAVAASMTILLIAQALWAAGGVAA